MHTEHFSASLAHKARKSKYLRKKKIQINSEIVRNVKSLDNAKKPCMEHKTYTGTQWRGILA